MDLQHAQAGFGTKRSNSGTKWQLFLGHGKKHLDFVLEFPKFRLRASYLMQTEKRPYSKKRLKYMHPLLHAGIALLCAMVMLWPDEGLGMELRGWWFYGLLLGLSSIIFITLMMIHRITLVLDRKTRWEDGFLKRGFSQLMFGFTLPVIICFLLSSVYFRWLWPDITTTSYAVQLYFLVLGIPLLLNCCYCLYYLSYFFRVGIRMAATLRDGESFSDDLIFHHQGGEVKVKTGDIAYIVGHGKNTTIQPHEGDPIILKLVTLKQVQQALDPNQFCKVNRSYIITFGAYQKSRRHDRGLLLFLCPEPDEPVIVSRDMMGTVLQFIAERQNAIAI